MMHTIDDTTRTALEDSLDVMRATITAPADDLAELINMLHNGGADDSTLSDAITKAEDELAEAYRRARVTIRNIEAVAAER